MSNQGNPKQIAQQLTSLVDELKTSVHTAAQAGESFDSVERMVLTSAIEIGQRALELLLALQGDGDLGEEILTSDGKTARRSAEKSRTPLRSIFGEHAFEQFT